jgi:acetyltransferase-like isoleucine patch superfamily enzyme
MRDLEVYSTKGKNPMQYWYKIRNPLRVIINFLTIFICRYLPSLMLKNILYRSLGMKIGKDVSVALMVMFDIFFPEEIEIGSNSVIGYNTTILAHEYLVNEWRKGRVIIGKNVMIGANTTILPGIKIGDGAKISACTLVNKDIAPGAFVGGYPVRNLRVDDTK